MSMLLDVLRKQAADEKAAEKALGLEQKRMYATERENYLRMHMAAHVCKILLEEIQPRLELAGCVDQMKTARESLNECMKRVFYTVPEYQRKTLENNAEAVTYAIGVKTPGSVGARNGDSNWGMYLSYADIGIMVEAARDHCITCMGTPQEQASCELRKTFDRMGVDADHVDGECGYRMLI